MTRRPSRTSPSRRARRSGATKSPYASSTTATHRSGSASRNSAHSPGSSAAPVGLLGSQIQAIRASTARAVVATASRSISRSRIGTRSTIAPRVAEEREAAVSRHDVGQARARHGRDLVTEVDERLLGVEPDVLELCVDRVEHSRQWPEEVLVPAQLDDLVEAVEFLHLRDGHAERELVEPLELRDDDAAPVRHGATLRRKSVLLSLHDK